MAIRAAVHTVAGAVSGAINSAITGSDIGLGMLTGAVGAGIGAVIGGALSYFKINQFGYQLVARTVAGGIAGGIVSEIYGGNFWQGFAQGAGTAAAAFLFNCAMTEMKKIYLMKQGPKGEWITVKELTVPKDFDYQQFNRDPLRELYWFVGTEILAPYAVPFAAGAATYYFTGSGTLSTQVFGWTSTLFNTLCDRPAGIPLPGIRRINPIMNPPDAW